ncbi:hypothetical protein CEUSTIGMA_g11210.t1 [Chlamydomonas eustigma]|uniref:Uncharacterized protein n=1 Tax=Chlamydomonas eustigma TaxID=1157962 RepID=A0A250XL07_9CHLO|nr:hypothetical protein CEUSTIGMA_g11210.t1 [Chlamydomonas eustigma]|eukprot:GAX83785.1 hypothetical protein CEUSTIGMA_g11210.t1 [Chlamydomonas eustigma]
MESKLLYDQELLCKIVRMSGNAQGCAGACRKLLNAVLRSSCESSVEPSHRTNCFCQTCTAEQCPTRLTKLTLHVKRDCPRFYRSWFEDWSQRLRQVKDTLALHLVMEDGDGAETRAVSMRDSKGPPTVHMLQWVLNGVEEAVHAITVRRIQNSVLFSRPNGNGGRGIEDFFSGLSNLQSLNLSGALKGLSMDTDPQLQLCLIALPQLQALDLSRNGLVGANISALHDAWAQLTRLRSLNLGFNTLRTDAAQSVAYALSKLSKLTYLDLADSSLFYSGGGGSDDYDAEFGEGFNVDSDLQESCCLLSFALGNLEELKALDMSYSEFTDTGGLSAFASALVSSTALEHLSLDKLRTDTGYERTGAQVLFPALRSMTGLQHLSWVKCPGDSYNDEYCHFASTLEGLKGLRCLDLSKGHLWNQRSPLSIALQTLTGLEYLNVSKTNIHYTEENEEDCYHDYGYQDLQAVTEVTSSYKQLQRFQPSIRR